MISTLLQDRKIKGDSEIWANWQSELTITSCIYCQTQHGTIVSIEFSEDSNGEEIHINAHPNCKGGYNCVRLQRSVYHRFCGNRLI